MQERRNKFGFPRMFANLIAHPGGSLTARTVQIFNQALPWFAILFFVASVGLGISLSNQSRLNDASSRLTEVQLRYESRIAQMQSEFSWKIDDLKKSADMKEREVRMLEYYVVQMDGKLVAHHWLKASETWAAKSKESK